VAELTKAQILEAIPHQAPFRFIDEIVEIDADRVLARYTFRPDEFFYGGHFPGYPVTPGVILTEAMCQMGVLPLGIIRLAEELGANNRFLTVLTEAETEYFKPVPPGMTVSCRGELVFWKRRKLRAKLELRDSNGELVAVGTASGIGVKRD
jgi:3-hydroxyacyl-[acyl-carrier-protein] dehydratase